MRINRYLALHKFSTRRGADELIKAGKVKINGRVAALGDQVLEPDRVSVDEQAMARIQKHYVYFAYHKPMGVVTESLVDTRAGVFPVGRLDQASRGLLILTNDGRVTDRLLNPIYDHEKEYIVTVNKPLKSRDLTRLAKGVKIEDGITRPARVTELGATRFSIALTEGKKHQIRRMVTALGCEVVDLERVRVMNVRLGSQTPGTRRALAGKELADFLRAIGL